MKRNKAKFIPIARGQNQLTVMAKSGDYEMNLIGAIGKSWYDDSGITEKEFRNALNEVPEGQKIKLRINSEGGSVQEGLGIYNAIKERSDDITACITGYALSIASVFPLAAGKVVSPKSAIWMMHEAWCDGPGNKHDKLRDATMLEAHDEALVDIYAEETGKSKKDIRDAMEKETWIRGKDAVEFGLADETEDEDGAENSAYRPLPQNYLTRCKNISPAILNCLRPEDSASAAQNGGQQPTPPKDTNTMNKKLIVALLKKHGIEAAETETEEQLNAKLEKIPTVQPQTTTTASSGSTTVIDLTSVHAEIAALKKQRMQDRVEKYVEARKITNAEVAIYTKAAMDDEKGTFDILDAKESTEIGGEPIGFSRIEAGTPATLNGYQGRPTQLVANMWTENKTPEARYNAFKSEFPRMLQDGIARDNRNGRPVYNTNTFSATITTNFLIQGAITKLGPQVAMLKAFTKDNSVDPYKPLATGVQKFNVTVQDGTDTQTNATDFSTSADSTLNAPTISVAQYTQGLHLTNSQLNSGIRMSDLIEAKLGSLRSKIAQVVTTPITNANFGGQPPLVQSPIAFGFSDLATLLGQLKKSPVKNLILDGEYIARISNTPGFFQTTGTLGGSENAWKAFGWDMICLNTEWQAADPNVRGFACNPQAIGIVTGLPLNPPEGFPGNIVQTGTAELSGPDIAIATYLWFDVNVRTLRATYDIMLGATSVDTSSAIIIRSA